ncbi:MAG: GNAT family N-acetyltransferase [Phycisphaerales bacterium]|nr:GNAT family N-acetyltransferase [Phycisphaerales bacterium]
MSSKLYARAMAPGLDAAGPLGELATRHALEVPSRILTTERFVLRPLVADDRAAFLDAIRVSRAELDRTHPLHEPGESDDELFLRQLRLQAEGERTGRACRRVGAFLDGTILGAFNVNAIARGLSFEGELSWWVRTDMAGRGLASEGVGALAAHALADLPGGLGLHTLHAMIEPGNRASLRIAAKLGFTAVRGVSARVRVAGEWRAHDVFALTSESFPDASTRTRGRA